MGCNSSKQTATIPNGSPRRNTGRSQQNTPRGKYVVNNNNSHKNRSNGVSSPQSKHSDSTFSDPTDKGFKKRLRENLRDATRGKDIDELDKAMDRFMRNNLDDCGDWTRAVDRMEFLTLKRDLRDAVRRSHVGTLEKTILDAEESQFEDKLHVELEECRQKLHHLKELDRYKHSILAMDQGTMSEMHSYQSPPACVHDVMAATCMLLGYKEHKLQDWHDVKPLMCAVGRDSLIHQIQRFDSAGVDDATGRRVQEILAPHELHTVRVASNGAATFYVWATQICEKVERDRAEEEDNLRKEEIERQKKEEKQKKGSPKKEDNQTANEEDKKASRKSKRKG